MIYLAQWPKIPQYFSLFGIISLILLFFTDVVILCISIDAKLLSYLIFVQGPCRNLTCFPPDVKCYGICDVGTVTVPLMNGETITQQPVDFIHLEDAYSHFATEFIRGAAQKHQPFFLYYPSHVSQQR